MFFAAGLFGYFSHNWWNGILLFIFFCVVNGIINWVKEGRL